LTVLNVKQAEDKQESFFYQRIEDCIHWKLSQWSCNQTYCILYAKYLLELISRSWRSAIDYQQDVWWSQSSSYNSTTVFEAVSEQDLLSWILNEISEI